MKQFKNLICILLSVLMLGSAVVMSVSATENDRENAVCDTTISTDNTETTNSPQPDCDSKPVQQETTDSTAETDPPEPDCDSKPVVIPTSDPTATTEEASIPLTGPDGTAPTDPEETTTPTVTDPTETTTAPTSSQQPAETTESTEVTNPTETTLPTESSIQTEPTEPTETTQPDTTPRLNKKKLKLDAGETFNLKVKYSKGVRPRYSSDNINVAIVSSSGKVTALKKGTANITVRLNDQKFTCKVTVKNNPKLKKAGKVIKEIELKVGQRTKVNLIGKAEAIKNAYFNTPTAYFSALPTATKLTVVARQKGTTTIKVRVNNTKYVKLKVIVK